MSTCSVELEGLSSSSSCHSCSFIKLAGAVVTFLDPLPFGYPSHRVCSVYLEHLSSTTLVLYTRFSHCPRFRGCTFILVTLFP